MGRDRRRRGVCLLPGRGGEHGRCRLAAGCLVGLGERGEERRVQAGVGAAEGGEEFREEDAERKNEGRWVVMMMMILRDWFMDYRGLSRRTPGRGIPTGVRYDIYGSGQESRTRERSIRICVEGSRAVDKRGEYLPGTSDSIHSYRQRKMWLSLQRDGHTQSTVILQYRDNLFQNFWNTP